MGNTIPRSHQLDKMTPAEKAIYDAMQEVEKLPAHVMLTEVVTLLNSAKDLLSFYVDNKH